MAGSSFGFPELCSVVADLHAETELLDDMLCGAVQQGQLRGEGDGRSAGPKRRTTKSEQENGREVANLWFKGTF